MQRVGIQFDSARAVLFAEQLREKETEAVARAEQAINRKLERTKTGGVKTADLQHAFFAEIGVPGYWLSELTGKPSLSKSALASYATVHDKTLQALALAELDRRRAVKIRGTYIESLLPIVDANGRIHPTWQNYGTVGGRWSCAGPNLCNLPRASTDPMKAEGGIRSLYTARPGFSLVYYDKSQIEFRIAAYGSGDEAMIATCEGGDVHSGNAAAIFGAVFDPVLYKALKKLGSSATPEQAAMFAALDNLRTLAKSAVFAVCYMATAETVFEAISAQGIATSLARVKAMLNKMQAKYHAYYRWQDENLMEAVRTGIVRTPILGRERFVGHSPGPPEVANFPIQGGAADVMNPELIAIDSMLERVSPQSAIVAHVYDSVLIETPANDVEDVQAEVNKISLAPISISSSGREYRPVLKIDMDVLDRWK
jgi:DNA polymerase-1